MSSSVYLESVAGPDIQNSGKFGFNDGSKIDKDQRWLHNLHLIQAAPLAD